MKLTEKQQIRLSRVAKVLDGGNISLLKLLDEVEETLNSNVLNLDDKLTAQLNILRTELEKLATKRQIVLRGDTGEAGKDGRNGTDYILTSADKQEIASRIKVPVVEKVIEIKTEVIRETPIVTEIKTEIPVNLSPDEVRNMLELLQGDERLDASAIKNLPEAKGTSFGPANGPSGLKVYVDGTKQGQLREVNFKAGTGMTLTYSLVSGLPTITFASSGGASRTGERVSWAGSIATVPTGALFCNGASLLRAGTYAALFAKIGTIWGAADGTHFNIPDSRDRVSMGASVDTGGVPGSSVEGGAATQCGGASCHNHTIPSLGTNGHTHPVSGLSVNGTTDTGFASIGCSCSTADDTGLFSFTVITNVTSDSGHTHTFSGSVSGVTDSGTDSTVESTTGTTNNVPRFYAEPKIIFI